MKPGDLVRCIEDETWVGVLTKGNTYTIASIEDDMVRLKEDECGFAFHKSRFELFDDEINEVEQVAALPEKRPPQVIDNEQIYCFDVDDTLVLWDDRCNIEDAERVKIIDPYDGHAVYLRVHVRHIKLLKQMRGRNRFVVVWSQGGAQWAKAVVEALGLNDMVDLIMTKPHGYVDDLAIEKWCKNHIYLKPEGGQQ